MSGTFHEEIRVRGKNTLVLATQIDGRVVVCRNGWLRTASLKDEELLQGEPVQNPSSFIARLSSSGIGADLFTFTDQPAGTRRRLEFRSEEENLAVIPTHSFKEWWEQRLSQESRKNVRRAAKRGVIVRQVEFNDVLIRGIKKIYDETPIRQGRKFWHYRKELNQIRDENSTYLDRSWFVGAFFQEELIGFIKVIMVDRMATLIQILAMNAHHDKRPMNALLAHTVELCERRSATHLVYGKYTYGRKEGDSLGEFKRRNGFEALKFPRYYVPLTLKGRLALAARLHRGLINAVPGPALNFLLAMRARLNGIRSLKSSFRRSGSAEAG